MPQITITGAAARKIGRLSSLYPDAEIRICTISDDWPIDDDEAPEALSVAFLDQYGAGPIVSATTGLRCEHQFVVRYTGWSNPSVRRARADLETEGRR